MHLRHLELGLQQGMKLTDVPVWGGLFKWQGIENKNKDAKEVKE